MSHKNIFSRLWLLALAMSVTLGSCTKDEKQSDFALHYAGINDIAKGMTAPRTAPTYYGSKPSDFQIAAIKFNGAAFESTSFEIDPTSGEIEVKNTDAFEMGTYKVNVSCMVGGSRRTFADAFELTIIEKYPYTLKSNPEVITLPWDNLSIGDGPETSQITTEGEAVTVTSYSIAQERGKEFFAITTAGEVSINWGYKGEILPGDYNLTISSVSKAGVNRYDNVVRFRIVSAPLELSFEGVAKDVEVGQTTTLGAPKLKGYADNTIYSITGITPATSAKGGQMSSILSIDPATGAITATDTAEPNVALTENETFNLSIKVANEVGERVFNNALAINVVGFIQPVENFSYAAVSKPQGSAFTIEKAAGFLGDNAMFEFKALPAALVGQLTIDSTTGAISAKKSNKIAKATYSVVVTAKNNKGAVDATLALTIGDNPNYFTYIEYGNNLGLTPAANYANQFRYMSAVDMSAATLTPTTDATVALSYSLSIKHQMKETAINATTGALTLAGYSAPQCGLIMVTATAGKGTDTEFSLTVPVFFNFPNGTGGAANNLMPLYSPFVFQCNPKAGGSSAAATINNLDTKTPYTGPFALDYRRTFVYYNFNGPDGHGSGTLVNDQTDANKARFLYTMWNKWAVSNKKPFNGGSKDPISFYPPANVTLGTQLCYVNRNSNFSVVVNPATWSDNDGVYANGAFLAQMTCVKDDSIIPPTINNGQQTFPLWIWFDESF